MEVTGETALGAARRVGGNVACLVFASARKPGGGFLNGAQAQEESVARASALYACLRAVPEFYAFHRQHADLCYSDRVIYSPAVPVFRGDDGLLVASPYRVSFLTTAAPNLAAITATQPEAAVTVPAALRTRVARVLEIAAAHRHRRLVLGAWGCGVFGNDPAVVADAFAAALDRRTGSSRSSSPSMTGSPERRCTGRSPPPLTGSHGSRTAESPAGDLAMARALLNRLDGRIESPTRASNILIFIIANGAAPPLARGHSIQCRLQTSFVDLTSWQADLGKLKYVRVSLGIPRGEIAAVEH